MIMVEATSNYGVGSNGFLSSCQKRTQERYGIHPQVAHCNSCGQTIQHMPAAPKHPECPSIRLRTP